MLTETSARSLQELSSATCYHRLSQDCEVNAAGQIQLAGR